MRAVHQHLGQFATTAAALSAAGRAQINHALASKLARLNALMSAPAPDATPDTTPDAAVPSELPPL